MGWDAAEMASDHEDDEDLEEEDDDDDEMVSELVYLLPLL